MLTNIKTPDLKNLSKIIGDVLDANQKMTIDGIKIFNSETFLHDLKKSLLRGTEDIILDVSYLTDVDLKLLYQNVLPKLNLTDLKRIIVVVCYDSKKSIITEQLIKKIQG